MVEDEAARRARIRELNDALRQTFRSYRVVVTDGVASRGEQFVRMACRAIATYDDFGDDNDPHQEHDFGVFEVQGQRLYFKIDYYDRELQWHSPDPTNPEVTMRVLTILLAEEY